MSLLTGEERPGADETWGEGSSEKRLWVSEAGEAVVDGSTAR